MYHASLVDNDLYKFTMQWAVCKLYPDMKVRYTLIIRDDVEFPAGFASRLREVVDSFRGITLKRNEKEYFKHVCYYLPNMYFDFLSGYEYDPFEVSISQTGGHLSVTVEGYWYRTVLWEVPLMATISELYFEMKGLKAVSIDERHKINCDKAAQLLEMRVYFSEFGTRRRYSFKNQDICVADMKAHANDHFVGTSNPYFAMKYDLTPMGTNAHEWYSAHAAMFGYQMANKTALDAWSNVYQGDLGIALPDTFTTDVFLRSFNTYHTKLWDGLRHDSESPFAFTDKVVDHYRKLKVSPMFKTILYSDNINSISKVTQIHDYCKNRINDRYGLGTWMSNDVGVKPLNMVIKLTACYINDRWVWTVKLSDAESKNTGNVNEIRLCKETLKLL
jgi:nicotinate phosphoribosyltransferase